MLKPAKKLSRSERAANARKPIDFSDIKEDDFESCDVSFGRQFDAHAREARVFAQGAGALNIFKTSPETATTERIQAALNVAKAWNDVADRMEALADTAKP